jgi:hypothetical protein
MDLRDRIDAFSELGKQLGEALDGKSTKQTSQLNHLIDTQYLKNPWFTPENIRMAVKAIADELTYDNLVKWTSSYPLLNQSFKPVKVGVIMAGNIPLVGFHDFLSVMISGNYLILKTSYKDPDLIRFINDILCEINPGFRNRVDFATGIISGFDIVIATGSDNSSRYFEYYFGKYPSIIRKNRNSIAIIEGNETEAELGSLGTDVFSYFGLGCRSVSRIYVPFEYDFSLMLKCWNNFTDIISHHKYCSNYDFNKAVYLVNKEKFIDTGFLLLKESQSLSSPVAVLHYEKYKSKKEVYSDLERNKDRIQCIVGKNYIPFGAAQSPALWDYADGVDTIEFILKKNYVRIL